MVRKINVEHLYIPVGAVDRSEQHLDCYGAHKQQNNPAERSTAQNRPAELVG